VAKVEGNMNTITLNKLVKAIPWFRSFQTLQGLCQVDNGLSSDIYLGQRGTQPDLSLELFGMPTTHLGPPQWYQVLLRLLAALPGRLHLQR